MKNYQVSLIILAALLPVSAFARSDDDSQPKPIDRAFAAESGCAVGLAFGMLGGGIVGAPAHNPSLSERGAMVGGVVGCAALGGAYYSIQDDPADAPSESSLTDSAKDADSQD